MKIAVTSFGSEGDIRPFVALTRALRAAGHDAFLCAAEMFRERAVQAGIPLASTGPLRDEDSFKVGLERVMREPNPLKSGKLVFEIAGKEMAGRLEPMVEATRDVDLVVHHCIDVAGFAAARVHGKRRVSAALAPGLWNNRRALATGGSLGTVLNLALGAAMRRAFPFITDRAFRPVLELAGVTSPRKDIILEMADSPLVSFLAVSPSMVPPDPRWPATRRQTGYWYLDLPDYQPPTALREFVEAGEPPLAIGFGSMAGVDGRRQTEIIVRAVEKLGRRAVLLSGWGELGKGAMPASVYVADHVPHDWLYPRASLVVHHGGAGTTAAVTRAGVPHAVVWHFGDQSAWGSMVKRRGLGPAPLHHHKLSVERLAALIVAADRPEIREAARAMGERVRAEDGVGEAARAISQLER
ncbi:MAG TPA: glycosyltransferase [Myxococcales bacterium]|nr:glycosyltransferase [Myxococcales bacterium]